ncbi:MAG: ATP-dependent DNA helicase RecG [Rhodospirillales bacterium]|jgi:ATP-dependent DNA helicase RecG|nr:ATP-dependent DNA helicase RecG [Rhodospirillales bacterium]
MRPEILFPLFAPVKSLPGVGPKVAEALGRLAGTKVVDLLWHLPSGVIDRRPARDIAAARAGRVATLLVRVGRHQPPLTPRQPYRVFCGDDSGSLVLVFFHARGDYLSRVLPVGSERLVSGTVDLFADSLQMTHPDVIVDPRQSDSLEPFEPVYPLTAGLNPRVLVKLVGAAVARAPDLGEWHDPALRRQRGWPSWREAVEQAHQPKDASAVLAEAPARTRLAYDEVLANQLALALIRAHGRRGQGRVIAAEGTLANTAVAALGFRLTGSQERAIAEIAADMAAPRRMLRLLQGDVGSGKTVVALVAMLNAAECGSQAALMAPTEVLARQHYATIAPIAEAAGVSVALLTGRDKGPGRGEILAKLASGSLPLVVGTHALFQEGVAFKDLAFAVIDEQHRFGVHQRLDLTAKGQAADVLVMTATPIPRTLMLTAYGDMDASSLTEKPPGRRPVDTIAVPSERQGEVIAALRRRLAEGARAFWVCPLVEESAQGDLAAAETRSAELRASFGEAVGLMHGRMRGEDKDRVMQAFASGPVRLLVATTVIEVGVDVSDATVMVIEHAERFGLAQLHQLRGRVGRGETPSLCILLYSPPLSANARARLAIMRETDDGFRIAEEDLRLRGAGEVLGTRQSGMPSFRLADLAVHRDLLDVARDDVRLILGTDPALESERGKALRTLLYLFERDLAVKYLRSG